MGIYIWLAARTETKNMARQKKERVLTEKEKARKKRIDKITEELAQQGYVRRDQIISVLFANVMAFTLSIPFILVFGWWFFALNAKGFETSIGGTICVFIGFVALIVVHEGIHGLTWGLCSPNKFKDIEFGFIAENLTPYCTCGAPLKKWEYILGSFMPCLMLGIIPCTVAVYIHSFHLLLLGILMIMGAGGDLTIILKMLFFRSSCTDVIIMDHPTECGFIIFER